jgi:RND family efflux transporter MFP subunit
MYHISKFKYIIFPLFIFAAFLVVIGCREEQKSEPVTMVRPVKTATVQGFSEGEYTFPGRVEAGRKLIMSFRVPGRLIELPVKEGETIKKNQLIARLDPKDFQIALDKAQSENDKAEADYRRYQKLYEKNAVPRADLDLYRSNRDVAQSRLKEAKTNLSYTFLRAPFTGMIGNRYVENFMDVQVQQNIVNLNDNTTIEIKINVPENLILPLKSYADKLEIRTYAEFENQEGKKYNLERKEISSRADPQTQTFEVTLQMKQPTDITLLPGMSASVMMTIKMKKDAQISSPITAPAIAVIGDQESVSFVWIVDTDKMIVNKQQVKVGEMRGANEIIIEEGLDGGEIIVVAGMLHLEEGMPVSFWEEQNKE